MTRQKTCTICGRTLPISEFHRRRQVEVRAKGASLGSAVLRRSKVALIARVSDLPSNWKEVAKLQMS